MIRDTTIPELFLHGSQYEIEGEWLLPNVKPANHPQSPWNSVCLFPVIDEDGKMLESRAWAWADNGVCERRNKSTNVVARTVVYIATAEELKKSGLPREWIASKARVVDRIDISPSVYMQSKIYRVVQGTIPKVNWNMFLDPPADYLRKYGRIKSESVDTNHMPYELLGKELGEIFGNQSQYEQAATSAVNVITEFEQLNLF